MKKKLDLSWGCYWGGQQGIKGCSERKGLSPGMVCRLDITQAIVGTKKRKCRVTSRSARISMPRPPDRDRDGENIVYTHTHRLASPVYTPPDSSPRACRWSARRYLCSLHCAGATFPERRQTSGNKFLPVENTAKKFKQCSRPRHSSAPW